MIENIDRRLMPGNQNGIQKIETENIALCNGHLQDLHSSRFYLSSAAI
jgi:hypothetical protein